MNINDIHGVFCMAKSLKPCKMKSFFAAFTIYQHRDKNDSLFFSFYLETFPPVLTFRFIYELHISGWIKVLALLQRLKDVTTLKHNLFISALKN